MVLSRLSQLGARFLKESGIGQFCVTRRRCVKGPSSHYLYPMKNFPFSTAHEESSEKKEKITVTFVDKDGEEKVIQVPIGMSMLEAAHENDIELEGACEGSLACSTCHVIVMDMEYYNKLEDPVDEENDMLDLAFGLTETSRLGCQVIAKPELDGIRLALPAATRNFAVDGFVPKPH
ncbi:adrenodoxin-like protein 2, mitochondrial [Phoenix dactylifera]|uniref:Adrenodoxin-like protein 2, mitochondrial n=1 Tax=Phoenix dactylifera TaxID=42345 RepID=A0A8B9AU95_PHODC|nr:adrenodoxin-like protein 2, mitochondrial [Phoenix dactylifera]XP_038987463.1 adrenodoxin-like protein 2, mitochondrial [Phoenix dactylifera]XP_038987464.1 adrenodoxin-like protein 2, mitochondrial [Phoenix dactylifera]